MLFSGKTASKKKKTKQNPQKRLPIGGFVAWLVVGVLFAFYEFSFSQVLLLEDALHLLPSLVAMVAMFMTLLTTVTYAKLLLFESKDHDLLYSLPVSGKTIVAAKLATMYTLDSILNIILLLPGAIIYGIYEKPGIVFYLCYFVMMLFVTMIPILFASIISALFAFIASRFRHAQFVTVILFAFYLIGVMSISMQLGASSDEMMMSPMIEGFLQNVGTYYPPLAWFSEAVIEAKLSSALLFVGTSLLAFGIVVFVFGKFYGKLHEMARPRTVRRQYRASEKSSGLLVSLVKKDMKRLFSSAAILMNQLVGLLMLVVFAVMFSLENMGAMDEEMGQVFSLMYPFIFAMAASMVNDTTTSISLEGKMFPLLKSMPIPVKTILNAKLFVHMIFCAPVVIVCGVMVSVSNSLPIIGAVATVVIPLCYAYSFGIIGLLINLKKYKFDWTSEVTIAKNNLPMVLTMLGGMLFSLLPMGLAFAGFFLFESLTVILGVLITLAVIVAVALSVLMDAVGEKWFMKIEY